MNHDYHGDYDVHDVYYSNVLLSSHDDACDDDKVCHVHGHDCHHENDDDYYYYYYHVSSSYRDDATTLALFLLLVPLFPNAGHHDSPHKQRSYQKIVVLGLLLQELGRDEAPPVWPKMEDCGDGHHGGGVHDDDKASQPSATQIPT